MLIFGSTLYLFVGSLLAVHVLAEPELNRDKLETALGMSMVPLWPLWGLAFVGMAIWDWREGKRKAKRNRKLFFLRLLQRLGLVTTTTVGHIIRKHLR